MKACAATGCWIRPVADPRISAILLAAQREGRLDPLAAEAGVSHKCLVEIGGRPLIAHVLEALRAVPAIGMIRISIEAGAEAGLAGLIGEFPDLADRIRFVGAEASITDSVYAAAQGSDGPFVITTADNVLLTPGAVDRVVDRLQQGEDAVVALSSRESVLSAHPEGQRRFYRFTDGSYSNCNLYGLSRAGLRVAESFREGGQFAKNPARIARAFGILNLLLLRFGLVSLDRAMARLGRRFGVRASALVLEDGAHAIDVDNERTYSIAALLLERRLAGASR